MKLAIRVDSSYQIGSGHVMRCLTLAEYLRDIGWDVGFVCRDLAGNLSGLLRERDFPVALPPAPHSSMQPAAGPASEYDAWLGVSWEKDAADTKAAVRSLGADFDWLLVDHYALDRRWEDALAQSARSIFVIDDLANRPHVCRVLLDHNLNPLGDLRYLNLVPDDCRLLCGPAYALLRPEFEQAALNLRERDGSVRRILVFFGGVDASGETLKTCAAIASSVYQRITMDVVVGVANPQKDEIKKVCESNPAFCFHGQVGNMAELMAAADLAVGAGGTTSWERAFLGLPAIMIPVAENQIAGTEALAQVGAAWNLGFHARVTAGDIGAALERALANPADLVEMGRKARRLFGDRPVSGIRLVAEVLREVADGKA